MSQTDVLRFFPAARFGAVTRVTPVGGGMSGAGVFAVTTGTGDYILRIQGKGIDWDQSIKVLRLAAAQSLAPALELVDDDARAVVMAKAAGIPLATALANPAARGPALASLAECLGRLHANSGEGIRSVDPLTVAKQLWAGQSRRVGFPPWAGPIESRLNALSPIVAADSRLSLSHNDVNPGNVVWDGTRVWLVDWDQAARNHPYFDLAQITAFLRVTDAEALNLLASQEKSPISRTQGEVFAAYRQIAAAIFGLLFLGLAPDLTDVPASSLPDTLTLDSCFGMIATGKLEMGSPRAQCLLGYAMLKKVA